MAEGARRYFRARAAYRPVFAGGACMVLAALARVRQPLASPWQDAGAPASRRGLQDSSWSELIDDSADQCDAGLAGAFRDVHCDIPDTPSDCQLDGAGLHSYQCLYVDQASRLADDASMPGGAIAAQARAEFVNSSGHVFGTVAFRQLADDNATQVNVWMDPLGPEQSAVDYVSWQVYTGRADGLRDDECVDALGDPFHLPFTTAVQLRVAIGSSRLCRRGASHGTVADKSWECTEPGDNTGFETCDGQSFGGPDAAHPLPDFGTSRLLWPGPQPVEYRSDTAAGCWQRYADNVHGELALPLMAESEKLEGAVEWTTLVGKTIQLHVAAKAPGPNTTIYCAQIREVDRAGSCFLATHMWPSYFRTYYCDGDGNLLILVPFIMWLCYLFLVLGSTADAFFCPALASLSEMIGLTPRVAGVTLLALGNGAPDVFSIYASTNAGEYGIAVGEVTGAANFVCTGVVGICCIISVNAGADGLKARGMFLRDVAMLVVSTSFLLYMVVDEYVSLGECITFVSMYVIYVGMVIYGAKVPPLLKADRPKWDQLQAEAKRKKQLRQEGFTESLLGPTEQGRQTRDNENIFLPRVGELNVNTETAFKASDVPIESRPADAQNIFELGAMPVDAESSIWTAEHDDTEATLSQTQENADDLSDPASEPVDLNDTAARAANADLAERMRGGSPPTDADNGGAKVYHAPRQLSVGSRILLALKWDKLSWDDKIATLLQIPFTIIRRLTIPVVIEDPQDPRWKDGFNRIIMVLNPPCTAAFLVRFCEDFVNRKLGPFGPFPSEVLAFLLFTPFSLAVWRITAQPLPSQLLVKVYVVISFIAALFWINVVADELVALLATLGDILKLNHAILGLTVLGCGNSMADLAADMSVTRAGFPNMAVTAAYAGPFFNMCIGIGLSFLTKVLAADDGKFDYGKLDTTLFLACVWLIAVCIITMAFAVANGLHLPPIFGWLGIGMYALFCVVAVLTVNFADPHMN